MGRKFPSIEWKIIRITPEPIATINAIEELPAGQIGELIVRGPVVTTEYATSREANRLAKIDDPDWGIWHRMGDAGYLDDQERFWFCGRVAHRVLTVQDVLYPIPCEAILNCDPAVKRAALVGIGIPGEQTPVFVVEPRGARKTWLGWRLPPRAELAQLRAKLLARAAAHPLTAKIHEILFHPNFPVDIRHNAKIFREKLAVWAAQRLARRQPK